MVTVNAVPVINAVDKTINEGETFDPMADITATDTEEGSIKVVENTVDINKSGIYKVVYEVTDSQGAKGTKVISML